MAREVNQLNLPCGVRQAQVHIPIPTHCLGCNLGKSLYRSGPEGSDLMGKPGGSRRGFEFQICQR